MFMVLNSILDFAYFVILKSPRILLDFWIRFNCNFICKKHRGAREAAKDETRRYYQRYQQGP